MRSCSGEEVRSVCKCVGGAVFEGAVIGQVFTGDVQTECPLASQGISPAGEYRGFGREQPLASFLFAIAIWQLVQALQTDDGQNRGLLVQALLLLASGVVVRYLRGRHLVGLARWAGKAGVALVNIFF